MRKQHAQKLPPRQLGHLCPVNSHLCIVMNISAVLHTSLIIIFLVQPGLLHVHKALYVCDKKQLHQILNEVVVPSTVAPSASLS